MESKSFWHMALAVAVGYALAETLVLPIATMVLGPITSRFLPGAA